MAFNMGQRKNEALTVKYFRQNAEEYHIEAFVWDFLDIWAVIHEEAKKYSLEDALDFSKKLLHSKIEPFYQKHGEQEFLERYEGWVKNYASIVLKWEDQGHFLFPLALVTYEICYHEKHLFEFFLQKLRTKELFGTRVDLFDFLCPTLTNFTPPLSEIDILMLKAYQFLEPGNEQFYKAPAQADFANNLGVSVRTIVRRMNVLRLLQMVQPLLFLDMGKIGYETTFFVHSNPFPDSMKKYLLLSFDFAIGTFSLVQIPYKDPTVLLALQDDLDVILSHPLTRRRQLWNLTTLSPGEEKWPIPPSFLYSRPDISLITPSPRMDFSLEPTFDPFRALTPADFKIMDFLTTKGTFRSVSQLSQAIGVSKGEITSRLHEYIANNLVIKINQFFKLGLDLSVAIFVSTENHEIPWMNHFLTFPKSDIFSFEEKTPNYYFGFLKMPTQWVKPFVRQVDLIKKDFDTKFYFKIYSPFDFFRWGITLSDTYSNG
jgi:DNA-binding Lrp family transcriptional regulator